MLGIWTFLCVSEARREGEQWSYDWEHSQSTILTIVPDEELFWYFIFCPGGGRRVGEATDGDMWPVCDSSLPSSPPGLCSGQGKATTGLLVKDIFYFVLLLSDHCSRQLLQEMKFLHIFQIKICVNVKFSWLGRSMSTFMFTFCAGKFKLFTTYFTLKRGLSCVNSHVTF